MWGSGKCIVTQPKSSDPIMVQCSTTWLHRTLSCFFRVTSKPTSRPQFKKTLKKIPGKVLINWIGIQTVLRTGLILQFRFTFLCSLLKTKQLSTIFLYLTTTLKINPLTTISDQLTPISDKDRTSPYISIQYQVVKL